MMTRPLFLLYCILFCLHTMAQNQPPYFCGQQGYTEKLLQQDPSLRATRQLMEKMIAAHQNASLPKKAVTGITPLSSGPIVLPVVVHIIHNNGLENISDLQVLTAIQHLNEAYANTGYYDPADGVNTNIQFCMAQRDPNNDPTNGITRDVSVHTVMDPVNTSNDDQKVKNINRWNPRCYINIWIVASINPGVAGYASMPEGHGSINDGIVINASVFGTSYPNDIVVAHEMGHYLGLYHTFEGGCSNTDCSIDGDRVCDTPPDQSTVAISCNQTVNSCSTDALSGFTSDQNDLTTDYMDYGNTSCMKVFTQGQANRMVAAIQTIRSSLLACKSCMMPCPSPVNPSFITPANANETGTPYTFSNTSSGAVSYEWYVNSSLVSTATDLSYTFPAIGSYTIRLVGKTGEALCLDAEKSTLVYIACPHGGCFSLPSATPDTCAVNTFQKKFGGDKNDFAEDIAVDAQGYLIVTGHTRSFGAGASDQSATKFDPAGHILWSKAMGDAANNLSYATAFLNDGSTLLAGYSQPPTSISGTNIHRLDKQGNWLWSRRYQNQFFIVATTTLLATSDGGALTCAFTSTDPANAPMVLMKLDNVGNIQWSKQYFGGNPSYPRRMIEDGSQFAIVAEPEFGSIACVVFVVDKSTGALAWGRSYNIPGATNMLINRILPAGNRWLLGFDYTNMSAGGVTTTHCGFMYTDRQGVPQDAYTIDGADFSLNGHVDMVVRPNGNICISYGPLKPGDPQNAALAELTPDGRLVRARRYFTADAQALFRIQNTPDGGIVGIGNAGNIPRPQNSYIFKTDSSLRFSFPPGGAGECSAIEEFPTISQPNPISTILTPQEAGILINVTDYIPTFTDVQLPSTDYCSNPILCNILHITGMDSVCVDNATPLVYLGNKAPGCGLPVHWQLSSSKAVITGQTDSSASLVFKDTGAITLYAMLTAKCSILTDSLTLHAFRSPSAVDLGGDLALCKQSTVLLNAGPGFRSYVWQDGSVNPTYTAWLPGQYYVNALDYCDNPYSDAIVISQAPDVPFELGPDTALCRNDTLLLTAPPGFTDYSWSPAYLLDNTYLSSVKVYPQNDTVYLCTATRTRGCQVYDSIRVKVKDRPQHFLSAASPLCLGNEAQLQPIGSWLAYQWFDNSTGPSVTITSPGAYKLQVTGENGCPGWDSVTVLPGSCNPGIYFPNAFSPDNNSSNDFFKPVVTVALDFYYLAVYNRLGEKMFETKDLSKGWDGRCRGHQLDAGSFVWYAQYHITGTPATPTIVKGVLTLIR